MAPFLSFNCLVLISRFLWGCSRKFLVWFVSFFVKRCPHASHLHCFQFWKWQIGPLVIFFHWFNIYQADLTLGLRFFLKLRDNSQLRLEFFDSKLNFEWFVFPLYSAQEYQGTFGWPEEGAKSTERALRTHLNWFHRRMMALARPFLKHVLVK